MRFMSFYRTAVAVVSISLLLTQHAVAKNLIAEDKLNGAFIQFDDASFQSTQEEWKKLIEDMHKNGLRSLVIQFVSHDIWNRENRPFSFIKNVNFMGGQRDLVEDVLSIADQKGIDVHIGLFFSDSWWDEEEAIYRAGRDLSSARESVVTNTRKLQEAREQGATPEKIAEIERYIVGNKAYLEKMIKGFEIARLAFSVIPRNGGSAVWLEKCLKQITQIQEKYKKHRSFVGLYVPQEIPSRKYSQETTAAISEAFKQIADAAALASSKSIVSFSPFRAKHEPGSMDDLAIFLNSFLQTTKIKGMRPQDSVGLHDLETRALIEKTSIPFLRVCNEACVKNDAKLVPIVECWREFGKDDIRACSIERLLNQLELESALLPNADLTAFDLNHHLSPGGKVEARALRKEVDRLHAEK